MTSPTFALVSNFETTTGRPSSLPRPTLRTTYLKPQNERVFVSGRPQSVLDQEKDELMALVRSGADADAVMSKLAEVNAAASERDRPFISPGCFTSWIDLTGRGGGQPHGLLDRPYMPGFLVPPELRETLERVVRERFPQGAQLRGMTTMRAEQDSLQYHLTQLRGRPEDPGAHTNYGAYLIKHGNDPEGGEREYWRAIELDPNYAIALSNLANIMWNRGDVDQAEELHRRAFASEPQNMVARTNLARFLLRARNNLAEAKGLCEEALVPGEENADLLEVYGHVLFLEQDWPGMESAFRRLCELRPTSASAPFGYADALLLQGATDLSLIEGLLRQGLAREPETPNALINLAQVRFRQGALDEARSLIRRAASADLPPGIKAEVLFCIYAFEHDFGVLSELKRVLLHGAVSVGDFQAIARKAQAEHHPEPEFLIAAGEVLSGAAHVASLDRFHVWQDS